MNKINNNELLIVRHLKRNKISENILKKLVARYWLLDSEYTGKQEIFNALFNIVKKFELQAVSGSDDRRFFTEKTSFEPDFSDIWDAWIYRAKCLIRFSDVTSFDGYRRSAKHRNKYK